MRTKKKEAPKEYDDDIFTYHSRFIASFENNLKRIPQLKASIASLEKQLSGNMTDGQREHINNEKQLIINEISILEDNLLYTLYLMETSEIIEEYKSVLDERCVESFVGVTEGSKEHSRKKRNLLKKYINTSKKFDKFYILPNKDVKNNVCEKCLSLNIEMEDDRIGNCIDCGAVKEVLPNSSSFKNSAKSGIQDTKNHIIDVVLKFQGKQNTHVKDEVYENVERILGEYRLLIDSDLQKEKYKKVTMEHTKMALEEAGYSNHYDDCQLIHTNLTGKPGPDLSDILSDIYSDYDQIMRVYPQCIERIVNRQDNKYVRKSFMSGHYILYQILKRRNYSCKKEQFNILISDGPLEFHDNVYAEICKELGWTMEYLG